MPKKGKGKDKSAQARDKYESRKLKKELAKIGEDDIETILAQIKKKDAEKKVVVEELAPVPSPRANASLSAHPTKDALILFGGEFFNGDKVRVYNDLFFYNIKTADWKLISSPNTPPPRCSHQAVAVNKQGGQLWIFGGEFTSPTQSQFYHYKDLWVLNLTTNSWEQIECKNGPSPRSGHRMVSCKNKLILFGGYFDQGRGSAKYNNELWLFDLDSHKWQQISFKPTEPCPSPRSGFQLLSFEDNVYLYGGYSRETVKGREIGTVYDDLWCLNMMTQKWLKMKKAGVFPPQPRSGASMALVRRGGMLFGGVHDTEDTEEDLISTFCNDMYLFAPDKKRWFKMTLRSGKTQKPKKKKKKAEGKVVREGDGDEEEEEEEDVADDEELDEEQLEALLKEEDEKDAKEAAALAALQNLPSPRTNALLAVKGNTLYLYGGVREEGEKEITLNDMYSLDIGKFDKWVTLISQNTQQEWIGEKDEEDEEEGEEEGDEDSDDEDDEDDDEDEEDEDEEEEKLADAVKSKAKVTSPAAKGAKKPAEKPEKPEKKPAKK